MNNNLNIVIIGASRGIGYHVAKQLTHEGHNLFCISRNKEALDNLENDCRKINRKAVISTCAMDISLILRDDTDLAAIIGAVFPHVDMLLYNAGFLVNKNFIDFQTDEALEIFRINFFSAAAVINNLLQLMGGEKSGHIVNISSMAGFQGSTKFQGLSYYSASKAALASLSECLAEELKERNIKVNCLALGATQTEMFEEAFPGMKAPLSSHEMAEFISHFLISGHKYFNGQIIPVSVSVP